MPVETSCCREPGVALSGGPRLGLGRTRIVRQSTAALSRPVWPFSLSRLARRIRQA